MTKQLKVRNVTRNRMHPSAMVKPGNILGKKKAEIRYGVGQGVSEIWGKRLYANSTRMQ